MQKFKEIIIKWQDSEETYNDCTLKDAVTAYCEDYCCNDENELTVYTRIDNSKIPTFKNICDYIAERFTVMDKEEFTEITVHSMLNDAFKYFDVTADDFNDDELQTMIDTYDNHYDHARERLFE